MIGKEYMQQAKRVYDKMEMTYVTTNISAEHDEKVK